MQRAYDDMAERYLFPVQESVTLATLGVPPYSPPPKDWDSDDPASEWTAPGMESPGAGTPFADMVRTSNPMADAGAWRDDNRAPFWILDDARAQSGASFDDYVRTIDPRANPNLWRADDSAPRYAGSDDSAGYAVSYDPRAAALGAVRIPGLPKDAAEWALHHRSPGRGGDAETPAQLASILERWIGLELLGADFTPHGRGGYPSIGGGGGGGGGAGGSNTPGGSLPSPGGPIYRAGGPHPGNLKARLGEDLSFWKTLSDRYPTPPGKQPIFRPGKPYIEVDPSKLPPGAVYPDNVPPGHMTVWRWVPWQAIKDAIIGGGKFPK